MAFLRVSGANLIDSATRERATLRGAGLGGWMAMENFISGYPGCEYQVRDALTDVLGEKKAEFFFDKFLEYFFAKDDAVFFRSLGLNCIRIAVNYRHFEDDMNPRVLRENAFKHLDRVIQLCAEQKIYTIIDVHTAPGGQSGGWHCDSGTHIANFWKHKDFEDRFVWLWSEIASHYASNTWIAGYNVLNEPADPHPEQANLIRLYDRTCAAIRAIDANHIIFLDGNTFATDFSKFPDDAHKRWGGEEANVAFAIHDYSTYGFPKNKELYVGSKEQKEKMYSAYQGKRRWLDDRGYCVWNGEWGPVYARHTYDGDSTDEINARRYHVLRDQLEIYNKDKLSWSIWLYKDIGFQGMVFVDAETPYMKLFSGFLKKKYRLAADAWGADDKFVKQIYDPIVGLIMENTQPEFQHLYPPLWSVNERVSRISRTMLVAEYLVQEWAEKFRGMDEKALDELAQSFQFKSCRTREGLNEVLRENAPKVIL